MDAHDTAMNDVQHLCLNKMNTTSYRIADTLGDYILWIIVLWFLWNIYVTEGCCFTIEVRITTVMHAPPGVILANQFSTV